ncbi:MAG: DMT family transporter [Deltaproteobacteria bacterium]|nr:DMT family transporter [Deltaproteobacteria bacterium]
MSNPIHILYFILITLFWSGSFIAIHVAVQNFPPFFSAFLRSLIAMIFMGAYLLLRKRRIRFSKNSLYSMGAGLFTMGIAWLFLFWGELNVNPAIAAILNSTVPIFIVLLTPLLTPKDRLSWNERLGVFLGFMGILIIFAPDISLKANLYLYGLLAVLMMAFCYAIGVLWTRRIVHKTGNAINVFYQAFGSALFLGAVSLIFELPHQTLHWSWSGIAAIGYLGIFSSAIALLLFFHLIREIGSVTAAATTYCIPLIAILLDVVFLKKWILWNQALGASVILCSVFLINRHRQKL